MSMSWVSRRLAAGELVICSTTSSCIPAVGRLWQRGGCPYVFLRSSRRGEADEGGAAAFGGLCTARAWSSSAGNSRHAAPASLKRWAGGRPFPGSQDAQNRAKGLLALRASPALARAWRSRCRRAPDEPFFTALLAPSRCWPEPSAGDLPPAAGRGRLSPIVWRTAVVLRWAAGDLPAGGLPPAACAFCLPLPPFDRPATMANLGATSDRTPCNTECWAGRCACV